MSKEVQILVTLQVDSDGELSSLQAKAAARESVENAMRSAEQAGFVHSLAEVASVGLVDVTTGDGKGRRALTARQADELVYKDLLNYVPVCEEEVKWRLAQQMSAYQVEATLNRLEAAGKVERFMDGDRVLWRRK